ncbi:sigma 54-interacting transcriptional regulator [Glaciecola sp. XM2]|uniref:sigma 54-interacting transcriptional regulator n=1 Tax=Glaciecola sp. XM2 TaxID=1914931 RepID=UPI001BDE565E|nr:sigma 54-interacting transcriptional regulator [Glaciecola sp. XM2]MBT1451647.1 sigma 54-interacting transcriptional regulator [Glaciecola sp. XM2]
MNPTYSARQHLLNAIRLISASDYAKFSDSGPHSKAAFHVGNAPKDIQEEVTFKEADFVAEIHHSFADYQFSFTVHNARYLIVQVNQSAHGELVQNEQRRTNVVQMSSLESAEIILICEDAFPLWLQVLSQTSELEVLCPIQRHFFHQCVALIASHKIFEQFDVLTEDSLTKLKSRTALQRFIDGDHELTSKHLCMIHCRDFQTVNRKFGQAKGDRVLTEIADILTRHTREDDLACRFGGALFGIAFSNGDESDVHALAKKLQNELHARPYLGNSTRLTFNVGVASIAEAEVTVDNTSASALLIQRAELALKAAQSSDKPSIVSWQADKFAQDEQEFNYLGGIFTPDNITNYRNMLLLWDITSIIADEYAFERLLAQVTERLACTFEFSHAGIITNAPNSVIEQNIAISEMAEVEMLPSASFDHQDALYEMANSALSLKEHVEHEYDEYRCLVIPVGSDLNACFYFAGLQTSFQLTHDSTMLFAGFARQMGKALKRSQLEDELNRQLEQQNAQLEAELKTLKTGLQSSALVYRSEIMQKVAHQTQRAAQTDTTVLITGESGTGKEKLIHAVHALSPRSKAPLVIVDCGSIPESLIESELFGHVKGAFTGAQSQSIGKISAADGGVLVLDEIGELPLSMQPKLLRFVQEKSYTPIGGTKSLSVDVKIVAVTNRDLNQEVRLGKFRQDLFYRLNVLHLHSPALRKRLDDLELLCIHFLSKFASQFEMPRKHLTADTLARMRQYSWPGNVRELENKLMQASLLCQGDLIEYDDLNLEVTHKTHLDTHNEKADNNVVYPFATKAESPDMATATQGNGAAQTRPGETYSKPLDENTWLTALTSSLENVIDELSNTPQHGDPEVGVWMENCLFQHACRRLNTNKEIALLFQLPISTARRKVHKAQTFQQDRVPSAWPNVIELLQQVADGKVALHQPLQSIKMALLRVILAKQTINMTQAAQFVGVSEPTLYKLKRQL